MPERLLYIKYRMFGQKSSVAPVKFRFFAEAGRRHRSVRRGGGFGIIMAKRVLHTAITAANEKSHSTP